jgi:hypothetical protein
VDEIITGLEDEAEKLQLAPNPATTSFKIVNLPQAGERTDISVMDTAGRNILVASTTDPEVEIGCSSLRPGVYVVLTRTGDKVKYSKIVIK